VSQYSIDQLLNLYGIDREEENCKINVSLDGETLGALIYSTKSDITADEVWNSAVSFTSNFHLNSWSSGWHY
jgi:hypothetical protein